MKKPVGIESGNVRAAACGNDDRGLCLDHHAAIALYLCLLPLGHKEFRSFSICKYNDYYSHSPKYANLFPSAW